MGGQRITDTLQIAGTGEIKGSITAAAMPTLHAKWVKFKALADNAGVFAIGITSGVTLPAGTTDATSGWPLSAGEETDWMPVPGNDMDGFYYISTAATDDVAYEARK